MLAHSTGQILNKNNLSVSPGISQPTVTSYIELPENEIYPLGNNIRVSSVPSFIEYVDKIGSKSLLLLGNCRCCNVPEQW